MGRFVNMSGSVKGNPSSMQKSLSMDDAFFISTDQDGIYEINTKNGNKTEVASYRNLKASQLITVSDPNQMIAVDTDSNLIQLITLDSSAPPETLLCKTTDCCKDNGTCLQLPNLHLGQVAISAQNPYHLYFVNGTTVQELNLTSENPQPAPLFSLNHEPKNSLLNMDNNQNILSLVTTHGSTMGSFSSYDLLSNDLIIDQLLFSAPPQPRILLQLPDLDLFILNGDNKLKHVDIKSDITNNVCAVLTEPDVTFMVQSEACQQPSSEYRAITTDDDYLYLWSTTGDIFILEYSCESTLNEQLLSVIISLLHVATGLSILEM